MVRASFNSSALDLAMARSATVMRPNHNNISAPENSVSYYEGGYFMGRTGVYSVNGRAAFWDVYKRQCERCIMKFEKIKEILKNRKVQIITGTVAGVLALTVVGTIILNNKNVENKNIIVEKDDKKASNKENDEIKEQLEELKSIDTSNMSDEEKKELENKIADTEKKVASNNDEAGKEAVSYTHLDVYKRQVYNISFNI